MHASDVVVLLTNCMNLPELEGQEVSLLRELAHVWGMGQQALWGSSNSHRAREVESLFLKCQALLRVSQP